MARIPYQRSDLSYDKKTEKYTFTDDGVNWQWGDTYINAGDPDPILKNIGGKYHRNNSDGSHTEYYPHELMFASFVLSYADLIRKVDKKLMCVIFKKEEYAKKAYYAYHVKWYKDRGLKDIILEGKRVYFFFEDWTWERTYFAAEGPDMSKGDWPDPDDIPSWKP